MISVSGSGGKRLDVGKLEPSQRTAETYPSLALNVLFHQLRADHKYHILDLGNLSSQNVTFFSQFRCKLYIQSLYDSLTSFGFPSPEDGFPYESIFEYLMPFPRQTRFDIVLAWDILNYLDRDECRHLITYLSRFCQSGTLLFALISNLKHILDKPINFSIVDRETLHYGYATSILRPCSILDQTELNSLMHNFRVSNSFLLRNGFKEFLFIHD